MKLNNREIKGVLLDITGVLYESGGDYGSVISGSVEAVTRLKTAGIPFRLVTNESTTTTNELLTKLKHHGYSLESSQLFSPIPAVKKFLTQNKLMPYVLVHDEVTNEFIEFNQETPNCVVLGDAEDNFSFGNMNAAFNVLVSSKNPILLSMGKSKFYRHNNKLQLDVGAFATALEYASGIDATIIGKPSPEYFKMALDDMGVDASEAVMVGDDIVSDIGGALACGIAGVLVKTGKFTEANTSHSSIKPNLIADNLLDAVSQMMADNM